MKGGNLRELTRWLELPGYPPIGTFLPVYDLWHTHTGRRTQNWSQIFKLSHIQGVNWNHVWTKEYKKNPHHYACESTLTSSAFLFNIWSQFGCDNDAICRLLQCTEKPHVRAHAAQSADYYSASFERPGAAAENVLAQPSHFKFSSSFPNFSGWFGIGPPGPFSKHIEDFMLPSSANIISQLFWLWYWC